jgi:serine/threonine protein phosphatase PrpC
MLATKDMERVVVPVLNPVAAAHALFTAAMEAGGKDNITVAIVDVERVD